MPLELEVAERMLEAVSPRPKEVMFDLGCGDARHLILACKKYQLNGVGIEIAVQPYMKALRNVRVSGCENAIQLYQGNIFSYSLATANIVFLYLSPGLLSKLRPKIIADCRPGTRIVAARFPIPDWQPTETITDSKYPIYVYVLR